MKKTVIAGIVILIIGVFILIGAFQMHLDTRPLSLAISLLSLGLIVIVFGIAGRAFDWTTYLGFFLLMGGIISTLETVNYLPDIRPILTTGTILLLGFLLIVFSLFRFEKINRFGIIIAVVAFAVALINYAQKLNIDHAVGTLLPGTGYMPDYSSFIILSGLIGIGVIFAIITNAKGKNKIIIAGSMVLPAFLLMILATMGHLDFLGEIYRNIAPLYEWITIGDDPQIDPGTLLFMPGTAQIIEFSLIGFTIILAIVFSLKNKSIVEYKNSTLLYLILMPFLAIFLFEMIGLPAGFFEGGDTTRTDLLVTNTMAAVVTMGMVMIAILVYILFNMFPFWVAAILGGLWWVLWKPWLLHHPDPSLSLTEPNIFYSVLGFLFLTGFKRVALPMILLIMGINLFKHRRLFNK